MNLNKSAIGYEKFGLKCSWKELLHFFQGPHVPGQSKRKDGDGDGFNRKPGEA